MRPVRLFAFSIERYIPNGMQRKLIELNSPAPKGGNSLRFLLVKRLAQPWATMFLPVAGLAAVAATMFSTVAGLAAVAVTMFSTVAGLAVTAANQKPPKSPFGAGLLSSN